MANGELIVEGQNQEQNTEENANQPENQEQSQAQEASQAEANQTENAENAEDTGNDENVELLDSGARSREYTTDTLHEGVDRLGRLDQEYPQESPEREDIEGVPDGPINEAPYFEVGATTIPTDLNVQESGVEKGNDPVGGTSQVSGIVTATDPEGGALQYFLRDASGAPTQELELEHGTITLDATTGEFVYTLNNDDADTEGLNQGELATDEVEVYVQDEEGLEGLNTLPISITIEGTNDRPTLTVESEPLVVNEDGTLTDTAVAVGADVDDAAELTYSLVNDDVTATSQEGQYGALSIDPNTGEYTYTLNNETDGEEGAVQSLAEGETVSETFTVRVQDEHGSWADKPVTVEITGSNDAPTVDMTEGSATDLTDVTVQESGVMAGGNDVESGDITASGVIQGTDIDSDNPDGEGLVYTVLGGELGTDSNGDTISTATTDYGTIVLNTVTGAYTFTLNDSAVDNLGLGDTLSQPFTFTITDAQGASVEQPISFTIEGTNDRPTLTVESEPLTVNEDGTLTDAATAVGADVDDAAALTYSLVDDDVSATSQEGQYGTLSIDANTGEYTYTLNNETDGEEGAVQSLAEGETVSETFTVRVQDEHGSWADKPVTVEITGSNDAPTVDMTEGSATDLTDVTVQESGVMAGGNDVESGDMTASGVIQGTDIDSDNPDGEGLVYTVVGGELGTDSNGNTISTATTDYGTIVLNTVTGAYTFTLNDNAVDNLGLGDSLSQPFTFTITDAQGASVEQPISFTIEGTNDRPTLSLSEQSLSVAEGGVLSGGVVSSDLQDSGDATSTDVDDGASKSYAVGQSPTTITQDTMLSAFDTDASTITGDYGTLEIDQDTGQYTYTLDPEKADSLAEGQEVQEEFTIYVQDEHGAWSAQPLTVNVTGGNDAPTMNAGSYLTLKDVGMVTDTSEDSKGRTPNEATVAGEPQDLVDTLDDGAAVDSTTHKLEGSANVGGQDVDNGAVLTYTFMDDNGEAVPLSDADESYTIAGADHTVTIGTNEDGEITQSITTDYGTITLNTATGDYSYAVDSTTGGTVDAMQENEWHTEQYIVGVEDEYGVSAGNNHGISIYVEGTNDQPTLQLMDISGENILNQVGNRSSYTTLKEDGVVDVVEGDGEENTDGGNTPVAGISSTEGSLVGADVDTGTTLSYGIVAADGSHWYPSEGDESHSRAGKYGTLTLQSDGTYSYELDSDSARLDALAEGQTATETLTFLVRDENGAWSSKNFRVRIEGTNDSPELSVGPDLTVWEDGGPFIDGGDASHTDVDNGATGLYSFGAEIDDDGNASPILTLTTDYGTVRINPQSGAYEYILDTQNTDVQALHDDESLMDTFTVYVTDDKGATDTKPVNVTIQGSNDGPVFGGDSNIGMLFEAGVTVDGNAANGVQTDVEGTPSVSGQFEAMDADEGDTESLVYTVTANSDDTVTIDGVDYAIMTDTDAGTQSVTTANGSLVLNMATGEYTYTLNQDAADSLLPGDNLSESIGVTATDPDGLTVESALLVTIEGTNDAPVIDATASDLAATINEDASGQDAKLTGNIVASDVDHADSELSYSFLQSSGSTNSLVQTLQGDYGHIVLNQSTGEYTYVLDSSTVQNLSEGDTVTETFPVRVVDALRASDDVPLTITITGSDDAPTISAPTVTVFEDSGEVTGSSSDIPEVSGAITVNDVDDNDVASFDLTGGSTITNDDGSTSQQIQGQYGTLTLNADGSYTYSLDANATDAIQTLNVDDALSESFDVDVTSGPVTQATQISVQIAGSNDAPELTLSNLGTINENDISITNSVSFYDSTGDATGDVPINDITGDASGYTDVDSGASHTLGFLAVFDSASGTYRAATQDEIAAEDYEVIQSMQGDYGMLTMSQDGTYTYMVDRHNPTVDGMEDGESIEDSFMVSVIDEHGATDTEPVTVTITGSSTEDGPLIYDVDIIEVTPVSVTEDGNSDDDAATVISQQGDIILSDTGYATAPHLENNGTPTASIVGEYGTVTLGLHENGQDATYTFTLHQGVAAVDSLYDGQVVEISYPVYINGEEQGSIAITITGTNDAPILDVESYSHTIQEEATNPTISGTVLAHDVDNAEDFETSGETEALTYTFSQDTIDDLGGGSADTSVEGYETVTTQYGSMTLNTATGEYTYTLSSDFADDSADLPAGTNPQELFEVVVSDGKDSVTAPVTVNIIAENTAPELTLTALQVTEDLADADGHVMASGTPTVTDLDTADGPFSYTIADENGQNSATVVQGTYGSLILDKDTGTYNYVLNNASEAVQALGEGEAASETFTYTVTDIHGGESSQSLVVNITGSNDIPELTVDTINLMVNEPAADSEASTNTVTGQASVTDVDSSDTSHVYTLRYEDADGNVQTIEGGSGDTISMAYGTMTLSADGEYSYTVDGNLETTKALGQGDMATENVTLLVQDAYGQSSGNTDEAAEQELTITIKGSNTAPELSLSDSLISDAVDEGGALISPSVTEDGTSYTFSGDVASETTDADSDAADLRYSINSTDDPTTEPSASEMVQRLVGDYGTLELDAETGAYTYTVDQTLVEALGVDGNASLSETFTILVRDEYGDIDQQQITMNIEGTNDAPVLSVDTTSFVVTEDGGDDDGDDGGTSLVARGVAAATDVDDGDSQSFGLRYTDANGDVQSVMAIPADTDSDSVEVMLTTPYGILRISNNGDYSFTLDNESEAVQSLGEGDSVTDSFTVLVEDSGGNVVEEAISITINGTNDAPTFDDDMLTSVDYDDESMSASGSVAASDVDSDDADNLTFSIVEDDGGLDAGDAVAPEYGSVQIEADGDYTYILDPDVSPPEGATDTFTVLVTDSAGATDSAEIIVDFDALFDASVEEEAAMDDLLEGVGDDEDSEDEEGEGGESGEEDAATDSDVSDDDSNDVSGGGVSDGNDASDVPVMVDVDSPSDDVATQQAVQQVTAEG